MGLKWFCFHTGETKNHYLHDIWAKSFPWVVEAEVEWAGEPPLEDLPLTEELVEWLENGGMSVFNENTEMAPHLRGATSFYFQDPKIARTFLLVFPCSVLLTP